MTNLETSPVTRRATSTNRGRRLIISLNRDDTVTIRLQGLRHAECKVHLLDILYQYTGAMTPNVSIPARRA